MERDEMARVVKEEQQVYSSDEDSLIQRALNKLGALKEEDFEGIESPDHLVKMELNMLGAAAGVGRATTVVDASIEVCAAWEMAKMSREQQKKPSLLKTLTAVNSHNYVYHTVNDNVKVPGFLPREFVTRQVWKKQDVDTLLVIYESFKHADYPMRSEYVRGSSRTMFAYVKLPPVSGVPQTRVTFTTEISMGGYIPKVAQKIGTSRVLRSLSLMRERLDKSLEIDGGARTRNVEMVMSHDDEYSAEETKLLEDGEKQFAMFNGMKAKALKMASPLATGKIAYKRGDRHAWGWATTTVRASPEEVLAYMWDTMRRSARREDDLEKTIEEKPNGHNQLIYLLSKTPNIVANRDFLGRKLWRRDDEGAYVLVTTFEESANRPVRSDVVRAKFPSAMRIKRLGDKETTLEYVIHPHSGGAVPSFLMNRYTIKNLANVTVIQEYFQALRGLEVWDGDDGRAVGEAMCIESKAEKHKEKGESKVGARMRGLFKKHKALNQIAEKHEFFQPMLTRVVENKLRPAGVMDTPLCDVSKKEGGMMARGLAIAMASNLTAEAGIDLWILQHVALVQFDKEEAWFRPMMNVMGKRLLGEVSWGLKMRLIMGAGLSILDLATDVFVIVGYMGKETTRGYGWSLLGMIVVCMAFQLITVFAQNKKKPTKMLGEMMIVLTGFKPGFDAARVIIGKEMDEHSVLDAKTEMVCTKGIEMACESIPGCVLQVFAILKSGDRSRRAILSVTVSAFTTGFSSGSISFDMDVDPAKRNEAPHFYGYIPDGKRTVIFGCMILNSALLLLVRSLSAAMLMLAKKRYFVLYMVGDMGLYLLQKVLRGDFHYWVPIDGVFGLFVSLLMRVLVKTTVDFTGVIHMRSPQELGGLYWTVNMFLALLASLSSVWIYTHTSDGEEVTGREAWTLVGCMSGAWLTTFGLFFLLMKKEYRGTFFDNTTGKKQIMNRFKVDDDAIKASVLKKNKKMWRVIRGEVKAWVLTNWYRWVDEKPLWFTEAWLAKLPKDFIPEDEDQAKLEEIRKKGRRRSSSAEALDVARIHPAN